MGGWMAGWVAPGCNSAGQRGGASGRVAGTPRYISMATNEPLLRVHGHPEPVSPREFNALLREGYGLQHPELFGQMHEEVMREMRYIPADSEWTEAQVRVKVENFTLGFGGLKAVQRAFKSSANSVQEQRACWEAYALKEYFDDVATHIGGGRERVRLAAVALCFV